MSPMLKKVLLSLIVPVLFLVFYGFGVSGGHDVVTGNPTPHFGGAFWGLLVICGLIEAVVLYRIWGD